MKRETGKEFRIMLGILLCVRCLPAVPALWAPIRFWEYDRVLAVYYVVYSAGLIVGSIDAAICVFCNQRVEAVAGFAVVGTTSVIAQAILANKMEPGGLTIQLFVTFLPTVGLILACLLPKAARMIVGFAFAALAAISAAASGWAYFPMAYFPGIMYLFSTLMGIAIPALTGLAFGAPEASTAPAVPAAPIDERQIRIRNLFQLASQGIITQDELNERVQKIMKNEL